MPYAQRKHQIYASGKDLLEGYGVGTRGRKFRNLSKVAIFRLKLSRAPG
jgi:hypothetical protein